MERLDVAGIGWKWRVCGLLLLASAINYMDRQTLAGASVRISREFHLTQTQYGQIEATFGYAFAVGSIVFGWAADRLQLRWVYAGVLTLWSLAGIATGWAGDYGHLLVCRAALGFFEAGHWPCALRTTRLILDERQRSLGNGLLQGGATIGAVITPLMLPLLMSGGVGGWRPPFQWIGCLGLLWLIPWFAWVRGDDFSREPQYRASEQHPSVGFWKTILSGRMLAILGVIACINTTWQVLRAWLPKFLQEGRDYSEGYALAFNSVWFLAADLGCIGAGFLATHIASTGRSPGLARFQVFAVCALLSSATALIPMVEKGPVVLGILLLVAIGSLGVFPLYHSFTQDISGAHQGRITGIAGVAGWIIPAQAQRLFGMLADQTHSMNLGLAIAGLLPAVALIPLWYLKNRGERR